MWGNTTPSTELPRDFCAGIGPPQLGVVLVLLPVSTVVLSGESLFGDHPPYLLPVSTMVLTGKTFLGDHPPFLLPVSTMVLTGYKIKRVPPHTNW